MLLAGLFFAIMNVCVKLVSHLPTMEVVLFRSALSLVFTYYLLKRQSIPIFGNDKPVLIMRGIAGCLGLIGSFYTLQNIPLATAVTLNYLSPFFTAILGIFIVRQRFRPVQWLYFLLSIVGVILLKGFDFRVSTVDMLVGLGAAFFAGLAYNMIAKTRDKEHALVIIFYFPLITLPFALLYCLFHWTTPIGMDWFYLLLIGILSQIAQYYMTLSYQTANLAKVASLNYLGVIYALGFGYIFFDETFNTMSLLAIVLIILGVVLNIFHGKLFPNRNR
jgi:drug/metabolite transporter (DMT)-like permease